MSNFQAVAAEKPKAIVLLFGWLGASIRHINKYSQIYNDWGCFTITGVADSIAIMTGNTKALNKFALEAAATAAKLMRASGATNIPVIVHVFSNGGTFVLERLECLIASAEPGSDVAVVGHGIKLGGQVFDSAPAYLHWRTGLKVVATAVPNLLIRWIIQLLFLAYIFWEAFLSMVLCRPDRPTQFWNHMKDSRVARRQVVYIYSTTDELTDPIKLQELIEYRAKKGFDIQPLKLTDTNHVQHLRSHPKKYVGAIDSVSKGIGTNEE